MPPVIVQGLVLAALAVCVALAVRSLWRDRRSGRNACSGDCAHCKGCR